MARHARIPTDSGTVRETISDAAAHMKDTASDMGRRAMKTLEEQRCHAAGGLKQAASTLDRNAANLPGGEKVAHLAHAAAGRLHATANYVRRHNLKDMLADLRRGVNRNPGPSLLTAAGL